MKYRVEIEERAVYECEIDARSVADARKKAEAMFLGANGVQVGPPFSVEVIDRDISAERIRKR